MPRGCIWECNLKLAKDKFRDIEKGLSSGREVEWK